MTTSKQGFKQEIAKSIDYYVYYLMKMKKLWEINKTP